MSLKTDYKDYVPKTPLRKFKQIDNGDGTVSMQDATEYTQTGDKVQAKVFNEIGEAFNAHTSDTCHIQAGEREKWNGKAEKSDMPTSLPANGGHAEKADYSSNAVSVSTPALRNVEMSTSSPSGGSDGDIWHQYK